MVNWIPNTRKAGPVTFLLALLSVAESARSATLPAAEYSADVETYSTVNGMASKHFSGDGSPSIDYTIGSAHVVNNGSVPYLSAASSASAYPASPSNNAQADATLSYYYEVVATTTRLVTVDVVGFVGASFSTTTGGIASTSDGLIVDGYDSYISKSINSSAGETSFNDQIPIYGQVQVYTNTAYNVDLTVENQTYGYAVNDDGHLVYGTSTAFSKVDPMFTIDPSDTDPSDLSLVFSAGVGNSLPSPVPLPASAPMFGAALLVLGAVGYGMKRKATPAAVA